MNIKLVLSLTVLFAGLAVVFVISSDTIIGNDVLVSANNMNTSNSEIHTNNDDLKNTKKSLGGTEEYEHDTIEVVNRFPSRKTLYNEGDQAFIMVNRAHHIFPDAWWPLSDEYGMYKVNGDILIGEDRTFSKNKLFE